VGVARRLGAGAGEARDRLIDIIYIYATFADAVGAGPVGVARRLGAGAGGAGRPPADLASGRLRVYYIILYYIILYYIILYYIISACSGRKRSRQTPG
jgi:hypothetical protein